MMAQLANPLTTECSADTDMGAGSCPGYSISLPAPACGLGRQWSMAHGLGTQYLCVRPGRSSWLVVSGWLTSS